MTKVVAERRAAAAAAVDGYTVLHSMLRGEYTEESNGARTIRQSGGKDRHSKVFTSRGPRDRRVRLSVATAIRFYDLQDRLGFDQPSKAVEWLLLHSQPAIHTLPQLGLHHLHPPPPPPPPPPNPPPNSPLHPSLTSNLPPPALASLNHPLISTLNPPLDGSHDHCHPHHAFHTISHAQDCDDHPPPRLHAININHHHHHTSWPSNPTPNPIVKHSSCPNLIPNPPQTSLEDDPQYSNYSSASSGAPIRLSSSPPNPTALQHNKRKRLTQSPTNHHQFSISDLQDDYTNCSSNFTSQPYLPAERLTIFNEAPMNYCSTSEYNNNNINNNIQASNNWLPSQDQLNAHTHHHLQFPNNAIQLYKPSFANHEVNTRLASFDEPTLAASHLIISQQVTNSLTQSCDMQQQLAPQQLDELNDYGVSSPSESTSMKASCCKGMQASNTANGYGGQPTGNYNCVSSASSATSNVVETNAFSGWAISNAGSYNRQAKFQYSTDQI